jgi:hypothetical protein
MKRRPLQESSVFEMRGTVRRSLFNYELRHKGAWGSEGTPPCILNFGITWISAASFTLQCLRRREQPSTTPSTVPHSCRNREDSSNSGLFYTASPKGRTRFTNTVGSRCDMYSYIDTRSRLKRTKIQLMRGQRMRS